MTFEDKVKYCLNKLTATESLLSAFLGVKISYTETDPDSKAVLLIDGLKETIECALRAGLPQDYLFTSLSEPLNVSSVDELSAADTISYYLETYPQSMPKIRLGIEILLQAHEIDKLRHAKGVLEKDFHKKLQITRKDVEHVRRLKEHGLKRFHERVPYFEEPNELQIFLILRGLEDLLCEKEIAPGFEIDLKDFYKRVT